MRVLDEATAAQVTTVCELIVPGCERTGAAVYIDALLRRMPDGDRGAALAAFATLAEAAAAGGEAFTQRQFTPEFGLARALACEAYYSDFVADGADGPSGWVQIGFAPPLAMRINKDWSYLGVQS